MDRKSISSLPECQNNPAFAYDINVKGTLKIIELARNYNIKNFIFASTSAIYEQNTANIFTEKLKTFPDLIYSQSKKNAEQLLESYFKNYSIPITVLRFFNTYGPLQSNDFVITKFINQALNNDDLTINGDGQQTRTFLYVDDNVDFILQLINDSSHINEIVNVGSDQQISILNLAKLIKNITGSKSKIIHLPPLKEGDMKRRQPDISKMRSVFNRELISLEDGIKKYLNSL